MCNIHPSPAEFTPSLWWPVAFLTSAHLRATDQTNQRPAESSMFTWMTSFLTSFFFCLSLLGWERSQNKVLPALRKKKRKEKRVPYSCVVNSRPGDKDSSVSAGEKGWILNQTSQRRKRRSWLLVIDSAFPCNGDGENLCPRPNSYRKHTHALNPESTRVSFKEMPSVSSPAHGSIILFMLVNAWNVSAH